jgi:ferric-dicitrate binding protein FerR (iron transport regulator)
MEKQYNAIGRILAKYPEITPDENEMLQDWLTKDRNRQIFEELTARESTMQMLKRAEEIKITQGEKWQKLLDTIQPERKSKHRKIIFWLSAAASVIIIAGVLLYTTISRRKNDTSLVVPSVAKVNDVQPGQFKAKLTLADGSVVVLDSFSNGRLVQQGNTNVYSKNGQLVYKPSGKQNEVLYNTLSTSKAQTYATVLSDGTKVWLNSESSIHYPVAFNDDVRKVEITGEAYFEVAPSIGKNGKRPFIVSAGGMHVEVLGTHFNINSYEDEPAMKTTLLEGKVRIRAAATNAQTILNPGEQAILKHGQNDKISVDKEVDVDAEVAWRFGYFNFDNVDLKTMMRQLERWYDVEVEYQGEIPDIKFLGKIPRELSLSQLLNVLQRQNVHFKMIDKKVIVTP